MRRKLLIAGAVLCLAVAILCWAGIGFYSSGSAVQDLKAELTTIYGTEYTGKAVETGTEDMVFVVEPKTWFLTNWNLRNALCMDYKYECKVIITTCTDENEINIRTITYQAADPMGTESTSKRAYLDPESKVERTESR